MQGSSAPPYPGPYPPLQVQVPVAPVVTQVVMMPTSLADVPGQTTCHFCQRTVITQIKHEPGLLSWLVFVGLFLMLCWPCCLIPFGVDSCKDVKHRCPVCRNVLHIYKRL